MSSGEGRQYSGAASLFALAARGERLLRCERCGERFWAVPDAALAGWDGERPMYLCDRCWTDFVEEVGNE